jgi:hypothetical protein
MIRRTKCVYEALFQKGNKATSCIYHYRGSGKRGHHKRAKGEGKTEPQSVGGRFKNKPSHFLEYRNGRSPSEFCCTHVAFPQGASAFGGDPHSDE